MDSTPQSEIRIPKSDAPQSAIRNPHSNIPARILVVDDDEANRELLKSILETDGYAVRVAGSGEEALAVVAQQPPDLILLDVLLPDIDGFEVTRRLKADSSSHAVSIILVTILEDRESRLKGLQAGADEFLSKPVDYTELLVRVKNQLRMKEYTNFLADHNRILEEQVEVRTAKLQESEAKYRLLIESLQEGLWMIDKEANTSFVNLHMAQMLGYRVEEMLGRPLLSFMDERGKEIATQDLERRKQGIKEQHDFEFLRKDGSRLVVAMETAPILDQYGNYTGALAGVMDITERKQAESKINEQLDELRRWHEATLGIGIRNIELKCEVNKLLGQAGQPPRYPGAEQE